jgi:hypothetical protein
VAASTVVASRSGRRRIIAIGPRRGGGSFSMITDAYKRGALRRETRAYTYRISEA